MQNAGPKLLQALEALLQLQGTVTEVAQDVNEEGKATAERGLWTIGLGTTVALILSLTLGLVIGRLIARPLQKAVVVLEGVATATSPASWTCTPGTRSASWPPP